MRNKKKINCLIFDFKYCNGLRKRSVAKLYFIMNIYISGVILSY